MSGFLDTNTVVRYVIGTPRPPAESARAIIESDETLILAPVVLAEIAYVLQSVYQVPRPSIVDALVALVRRTNIEVHGLNEEIAIQALLLCRASGRVSFADSLLWATARSAGPPVVYSFDRQFPADGLELRP